MRHTIKVMSLATFGFYEFKVESPELQSTQVFGGHGFYLNNNKHKKKYKKRTYSNRNKQVFEVPTITDINISMLLPIFRF